jgi:hypothetical protein
MSVLSSDDCQMILDVLNNKVTFTGENSIRQWIPIFDKLHDGIEGDQLQTSGSVHAKEATLDAMKVESLSNNTI